MTELGFTFISPYTQGCAAMAPHPAQPNTGIMGGKFLERGRIYKPGNQLVRLWKVWV